MSDQKKVGVRIAKVIDEVPSLIESDVIYIVRKGDGFDLHVSGSDGDIVDVYSLNAETTSREVRVDVDELTQTVDDLQSSLDSKVDKQSGYGLSQENYTPAEKSKLSSLEGSKFKGEYVSLAALVAAQPSPEVGSYAYVDLGVGELVSKYIWDSSNAVWVKQQGEATSLTPAEVKSLYEGNPDTNAFSDSEKSKLAGIASEATKNRADSENADKVHTHTVEQVTGLGSAATKNVGTAAGDVMEVGTFGLGDSATVGTYPSVPTTGTQVVHYFNSGVHGPLGVGYSDRTSYLEMNCNLHRTTIASDGESLYFSWVFDKDPEPSDFKKLLIASDLPATATRWPTWSEVASKPIVQTTGTSTSDIMSQKAITDAINAALENIDPSGPRPIKDHGDVATADSETVVCNVQESDFHIMSMQTANNAGTLTIDFANMPDTLGKHFSWHVRLRRGGRKTVEFVQPVTWAGGEPVFGTNANNFDLIMFYKVDGETIRAMVVDAY